MHDEPPRKRDGVISVMYVCMTGISPPSARPCKNRKPIKRYGPVAKPHNKLKAEKISTVAIDVTMRPNLSEIFPKAMSQSLGLHSQRRSNSQRQAV